MDGLRRALGDPSLGRVMPHLTLVPPVNVRGADLGAALEVLRSAAAVQPGPLRLTAGPPSSFLPDNPVLFLEVGGDILSLRELRDDVFRPPLERKLSWPWVPHFTLADGIEERRIHAALTSLDRYTTVVDLDRVVLLEEDRGRIWKQLADVRLGPPVVVATGGLAIRITRSRIPDPVAIAAIEEEGAAAPFWTAWQDLHRRPHPIVLTAHRGSQLLGTAALRRAPGGPVATVYVVSDHRGEGIGGHLLGRLESDALAAGWDLRLVSAIGPAGFYESRSAWIRATDRPAADSGEAATRTRRRRTGRAS
jgi:2'-5' RNA ligase/GNAT superfamily N-acetyltransferase